MKHNSQAVRAIAFVLAITGCDAPGETVLSPLSPEPHSPAELRASLTSAAAELLDASGLFPASIETSTDWITPATAAEQAVAYIRSYGSLFASRIGRSQGEVVNVQSVHVNGSVQLAATPHETDGITTFAPFRKGVGPYYVVPLSVDGGSVITVAVSVFNQDVAVADGRLRLPRTRGNDFAVSFVRDESESVVASPEAAAVALWRATDTRIATPPMRFRDRLLSYDPTYAFWVAQLESPVTVRRVDDGQTIWARTMALGPGNRLFAPIFDYADVRDLQTAIGGEVRTLQVRPRASLGFTRFVQVDLGT